MVFNFFIQVKNIGFTGVFRLIFKPLVDEFPCFGAVAYSLREKVSYNNLHFFYDRKETFLPAHR